MKSTLSYNEKKVLFLFWTMSLFCKKEIWILQNVKMWFLDLKNNGQCVILEYKVLNEVPFKRGLCQKYYLNYFGNFLITISLQALPKLEFIVWNHLIYLN